MSHFTPPPPNPQSSTGLHWDALAISDLDHVDAQPLRLQRSGDELGPLVVELPDDGEAVLVGAHHYVEGGAVAEAADLRVSVRGWVGEVGGGMNGKR